MIDSKEDLQVAVQEKLKKDKLLAWTVDTVKTPKGDELDFYDHRFLVDIYEDMSENIVIKKASQVGVTTYAMNKALWFANTRNSSIIYTFPTASDVSDFSKARLNPMIKSSNYLKKRTDKVDSVELKQFGDSFIYLRGAWSERQAISVDSDFNIHDELDFSKPGIIDMYEERLSHSDYAWTLTLSTPTIPEFGIDYLFNRSDKKEWFVTCPKCGTEQILKFPESVKGTKKEARYACYKCLGTITNEAKRNGEWKATGDKEHKVSGYHISQLIAPWIEPEEILRKYDKALHQPTTEMSGVKDFYNFVIGEAYGGENEPLNRDDLLACIQSKYEFEKEANRTVMGVDQGDTLHIVIFEKNKDGTIRLIHAGTTDSFDDLPNLMNKYGVTFCIIDALPNKHSARRFALQFPAKVYLCYYSNRQKQFIKWKKDREDKEYRVVVHKIESLDRMADRFKRNEVILPSLNPKLNEYIRHMSNWAKDKEEKRDGRIVWVYKKLGADHFTMATNYAMLGLDKLSTGSLAEPTAEQLEDDEKPITAGVMKEKF